MDLLLENGVVTLDVVTIVYQWRVVLVTSDVVTIVTYISNVHSYTTPKLDFSLVYFPNRNRNHPQQTPHHTRAL